MRTLSRKNLIFLSSTAALIIILCIGFALHQYYKTTINIAEYSQFMLSSSIYYEDMKELDIKNIQEHYSGIKAADILDGKVFVSTDGTAKEFTIIKANGSQNADNIQNILSRYCSNLLKKFQTSNREEYERVKGYSIRRTRDYVIMTISDNMGSGGKISDSYFDKTNYDKVN